MAVQGGSGVRVTGQVGSGLKEPDQSLGQKVPDWKEVMPNRQGARSVKVMEPRMEVILSDLQSRRDGGCVGFYLH